MLPNKKIIRISDDEIKKNGDDIFEKIYHV